MAPCKVPSYQAKLKKIEARVAQAVIMGFGTPYPAPAKLASLDALFGLWRGPVCLSVRNALAHHGAHFGIARCEALAPEVFRWLLGFGYGLDDDRSGL